MRRQGSEPGAVEHAADAPALGRALLVPDIACLSDNLRCCFQARPAALGELPTGALAACEACARRRAAAQVLWCQKLGQLCIRLRLSA